MMKISLTIDENLFAMFKKDCNENGFKISTRVATLIREDLEKRGMAHADKERK